MSYRTYDPERDKEAVHRIWMETGWLEKGKEEIMDTMVSAGRAIVADINGEPECLVITAPGTLRHLSEDLTMCAVTGVTTSRVARKQGFAKRLAAQAVALDAAEGAMVANLGMFEQGYYNQIGFGTIGYEHVFTFDPAALSVRHKARTPRRLTMDDVEIIHAARLARPRRHGAATLRPVAVTRADMMWTTSGFGLGYFDRAGDGSDSDATKGLSHFLWAGCKDVERGPYNIGFMVYQNGDQLLELMSLIRNLGDQVMAIKMVEPPHVQIQDLIVQPFKQRTQTQNSPFAAGMRFAAYSQSRICDLAACLERTHLPTGASVRFNLMLSDPIAAVLDETSPWRGVGGEYVVTLGPSSGAEKGRDEALPTLTSTVNAFTRLWLGVRPASSLAITDDLSGPAGLLDQLDWAVLLPEPKLDWEF